MDGTERYDFWSRFLLLHSPFLFPPKKRGKRKGEWCSKNRDQKSYLPVSSNNSSILTGKKYVVQIYKIKLHTKNHVDLIKNEVPRDV